MPFVFTIKGIESFAVADDRQRVVVIEFVIKLVGIGVGVSVLRRTGAVVRRVMLLIGVICITALRTGGKQAAGLSFVFA